jgi:hypothetical protein
VIDPEYHKASKKVNRHMTHKYPAPEFVGAEQDVVVVCNPVDFGDISLGIESVVGLIGRIVDVELLEGGMTFPKVLRGLLSSLNYLLALQYNPDN